ncbi:FumA C-terminus/TtdB family hydratase beta subunit [Anaerobacillus sp. MEB173]|uniref:FumA C-terminus/TtdB family hydratase beta subunit n=1 Tax=Anaerobacillus sp. MEB173 TaxID=3383345 RepID=UPI003F8ED87D
MKTIKLTTPLNKDDLKELTIGDKVFLTGTIFMARDAAHKRFADLLKNNKELPVNIERELIFYAGPCPAKPGQIIGSVAPTSSYRMDPFLESMFQHGIAGTIGKGPRSEFVKDLCKQYNKVCFSAVGGLSVIISKCIKQQKIIAYEDLGTEAIRQLEVEDLPIIVTNDTKGNDLYELEKQKYKNRV